MRSFHLEPSKQAQYKDFLAVLFAKIKENHASDLHLTAGSPPILRVDGSLLPLFTENTLSPSALEDILDVLLSSDQKELFDRAKNLTFAKSFEGGIRFKIGVALQKGTPSFSFRFIPEADFSLDSLGLPAALKQIIKSPHGLIVIAGPFDCGKSTTLAAVINHINLTEYRYIVTVENPIEHPIVNHKSIVEQREIGKDTPNASMALKFALKEDADVIVIANLEGRRMAQQALDVVGSGRMLIAVLDANYGADVLEKLHDLFPASEQAWVRTVLSENLLCILSQRLVPKIGGGRALAYEFIINTPPVRSLISEGAFYRLSRLLETTNDPHCIALERYLAMLVKKGIVRLEEALHESQNPTLLQNWVRT